ncbi:M36 family metallopeptidase [Nocardioides sp. B-3]|uniref:M36 family metallopeptidase n=1 Tax=Nocardioides sp. B-3 TaxID=2895565 RepID=UPI0021535632|nr:M36 family metallopeptidase [Nocardioides sp. B-3]UUZ58422.1 M36 family metallopeptidase [Nocardioides sp. B-3]
MLGCWSSESGCDTPPGQLRTSEATGPWDTMLGGNLPTSTTVGNNANTHEARLSPLTPGGLFQAPISPTREYTTEFTDAWNNAKCDPANLVPGGNDIDASVTNLFVAHNRMHDFSYDLGFTESNYNMQAENGGRGGVGGDPEVGNTQAGAIGGLQHGLGRDNANQITLQDGTPGITNQYLFQPIAGAFYAPCTDGGLDMGIVGHEYTHAISNRMVGGPDDNLTSEQGGAMGESWSDPVAAGVPLRARLLQRRQRLGRRRLRHRQQGRRHPRLLHRQEPAQLLRLRVLTAPVRRSTPTARSGTVRSGRCAGPSCRSGTPSSTTRTRPCSCAAPARDDLSPLPADQCPGNRRWLQLMFDSFLLQQGATSMLDARDAMLAADQMRFGGADRAVMWQAFARRGMGKAASVANADDHEPTPSFAAALTPNAPITFQTASPSKIYVGTYEARATPVADTIGSTELGATAELTPGTYQILAVSADRGFTRSTLTVDDAGARTVKVSDEVNVAAAAAGATIIGATEGSRNAEHLIDGTEATNWGGVTAGNVDETTPSVAVDPAGDQQTVRRVRCERHAQPGPRRPQRAAAARGRGPRLRLALHRAAPVRPRGLYGELCIHRRHVVALLHLARGRLPRRAAPSGRARPHHA